MAASLILIPRPKTTMAGAVALMVVRAKLLNGSCSVKLQPEV